MRVFTLLFGAAYCFAFYMELALFRFYPETGRFHLAVHQGEGPAILWYGWIATAFLFSAAVAVVVPSRIVDRLWPGLYWLVPALTILAICVYEKRWFL